MQGDCVVTGDLEGLLQGVNLEEVLCVLTTTSCFAPRLPDDVERVARVCKERGIFHVINNAYGLQCSKIMHKVREAGRIGRVDAVVQSTDKNFMVPVGGAIVASRNKELLAVINGLYPGRASISPCLDLFITFLAMGEAGYLRLLKQRKEIIGEFREGLARIAEKHGERILETKGNTISYAITCKKQDTGSKLFVRRVSGCRFVGANEKKVCGFDFRSYGSSFDGYPVAYLTAACAIGINSQEMQRFFLRLDEVLGE